MNKIIEVISVVMKAIEKENPELHKALYSKINALTESKKTPSCLPRNMITEHVRERNKRVGMLLAVEKDGVVKVGWSRCNRKEDSFDREIGLELAESRAMGLTGSPALPLAMKRQVAEFYKRCYRYFKDAKSIEVIH